MTWEKREIGVARRKSLLAYRGEQIKSDDATLFYIINVRRYTVGPGVHRRRSRKKRNSHWKFRTTTIYFGRWTRNVGKTNINDALENERYKIRAIRGCCGSGGFSVSIFRTNDLIQSLTNNILTTMKKRR